MADNVIEMMQNLFASYTDLLKLLLYMMILLTMMLLLCTLLLILIFMLLKCMLKYHKEQQLPALKKNDKTVVIGFFHPYCHAGGGGERVLWTAVRALQNKYKEVECVVYTGDSGVTGADILNKARTTFNITVPHPDRVHFIFLERRQWVEARSYPYFTLLGQSVGSLILGIEAMLKFIPDIYIDSMGYAFTMPLFKYLAGCKVGCYTHYPTISTDMLDKVAEGQGSFNNTSFISQSRILSLCKLQYYKLFAFLYAQVGKTAQVVMVNSSWTRNHILHLWKTTDRTFIVFPPCDTAEFVSIPLKIADSKSNMSRIVSVGQFRPEKDHKLQIHSFNKFLSRQQSRSKFRLVLIGGCRGAEDEARVEELRNICQDLHIEDNVEFKLNVTFSVLKEELAAATIGLHTMWNEHFGIGVVECMAAGTVVLAHNSGGPKMDIVTEFEGKPTGYLADSEESYANCMETIFNLSSVEQTELSQNARRSVSRFSEEVFEKQFLDTMQIIM